MRMCTTSPTHSEVSAGFFPYGAYATKIAWSSIHKTLCEVPIQVAIDAFTAAGNQIAARLSQADKRKWSRLLRAWERRNNGDSALLLALTIARDKQTAETLIEDKILEPPSSFDEAANDNDQLRIAARMAGPLPVNQIKTVINKVRIFASGPAPRLDETVEATRAGWARPTCSTTPAVPSASRAR